MAAAMGALGSHSVPIEFHAHCDVNRGGVLVAVPALLAVGLLRYTEQLYCLPPDFMASTVFFCCWR
jgi:hypothetical protein